VFNDSVKKYYVQNIERGAYLNHKDFNSIISGEQLFNEKFFMFSQHFCIYFVP